MAYFKSVALGQLNNQLGKKQKILEYISEIDIMWKYSFFKNITFTISPMLLSQYRQFLVIYQFSANQLVRSEHDHDYWFTHKNHNIGSLLSSIKRFHS